MLNRIRTNLAAILAPNTNGNASTIEAPRPAPFRFNGETEQARASRLALESVSMSSPVEGAYIIGEAFRLWFDSLPAEARECARWNLDFVDDETLGEFVRESLDA